MRVYASICDLCSMDGNDNQKAYRYYYDDEGDRWDVCKKHAQDVKKVGLESFPLAQ